MLESLPIELLTTVITYSSIYDITNLTQCSHTLYNNINTDETLWYTILCNNQQCKHNIIHSKLHNITKQLNNTINHYKSLIQYYALIQQSATLSKRRSSVSMSLNITSTDNTDTIEPLCSLMHTCLDADIQTYKVIVTGDRHCGVTSIVDAYRNECSSSTSDIAIRMKLCYTVMHNTDATVQVQLLDKRNSFASATLAASLIDDTTGMIYVIDLTNKHALINAVNALNTLKKQLSPNRYNKLPILLVGNKCDLINERMITYTAIEQFTKQYDINYIELSCVADCNIQLAFNHMLLQIQYKKQQQDAYERHCKLVQANALHRWLLQKHNNQYAQQQTVHA